MVFNPGVNGINRTFKNIFVKIHIYYTPNSTLILAFT